MAGPRPLITSFAAFRARELRARGRLPAPGIMRVANDRATGPTGGDACLEHCAGLRQEFRYIVYVGREIYCYWDLKTVETGTDFAALAKTLEHEITDTTSATAYYQILRRWAAAFHDGHVNALYKNDRSDLEVFTAPVRLETLAPGSDHERLIIAAVRPDLFGPAQLHIGDEITAVNHAPAAQALTQAEHWVSGSTARMRRAEAADWLVDTLGAEAASDPLVITVTRAGRATDFAMQRSAPLVMTPAAPTAGAAPAAGTTSGAVQVAILPGNVGYLRIDGFDAQRDRGLLDEAMDRLARTSAMILDLRQNGGGDLSGNVILGRLIHAPISRFRASTRLSDFTLSARPDALMGFYADPAAGAQAAAFTPRQDEIVRPSTHAAYGAGKPVFALTGAGCFSACDTFVAALAANGLATLVGEPTGGGTGSPLVFDLPVSRMRFRYSIVQGFTARNEPIEGVGTAPQAPFIVEPTAATRAAGQDLALHTAWKFAQERLPPAAGMPRTQAPLADLAPFAPRTSGISRLDTSPTLERDRALNEIAPYDEREVELP